MDETRGLLRHTVATLAYRAGKTLRDAPVSFAGFRIADGTRTPIQILAHIGDLLEWAAGLARGQHVWKVSTPRPWDEEVARFFDCIRRFDDVLAGDTPLGSAPDVLFQGPIADGLTHVGQLAMLRRLAGAPIRGENYSKARITSGRVGADQAAPGFEFD